MFSARTSFMVVCFQRTSRSNAKAAKAAKKFCYFASFASFASFAFHRDVSLERERLWAQGSGLSAEEPRTLLDAPKAQSPKPKAQGPFHHPASGQQVARRPDPFAAPASLLVAESIR